jgi:hypothetical protein
MDSVYFPGFLDQPMLGHKLPGDGGSFVAALLFGAFGPMASVHSWLPPDRGTVAVLCAIATVAPVLYTGTSLGPEGLGALVTVEKGPFCAARCAPTR